MVGVVVPSAFHANEGATAIRQALPQRHGASLLLLLREPPKALFEIHRSFKFALVVGGSGQSARSEFSCAFYLHDDEWLFQPRDDGVKPLRYNARLRFVERAAST